MLYESAQKVASGEWAEQSRQRDRDQEVTWMWAEECTRAEPDGDQILTQQMNGNLSGRVVAEMVGPAGAGRSDCEMGCPDNG
jgi:hypothetical protein